MTSTSAVNMRVASGAVAAPEDRFEFGQNWRRFLTYLTEDRIKYAEMSLQQLLGVDDLVGRRFLDIGSGSGLFSLAARRLGARVHSFDYDLDSVACTKHLRERFFPGDPEWQIESGSALDRDYLARLGRFDVVYSWGVLHHTGDMWRALDNACVPLGPGGKLAIALYNDTGSQSARWKTIKRTYTRLWPALRVPYAIAVSLPGEVKNVARALLSGRPADYLRSWTRRDRNRGMSRWHDIVDWVGGYPYEAARADEVFAFFRDRGFVLDRMKMGGGLGCNEFLFTWPVIGADADRSRVEDATPAESRAVQGS